VKGSFFQIKNFSTNKSISMHSEYYKAGIDPYKLSFRSIEPNGDVIFFYGRKFVKVNSSTGFYEILKDL
jgi:hypothetical protein